MMLQKRNFLGIAAVAAAALIVLSSCRGGAPTPAKTPSVVVVSPFGTEEAPPDEAAVQVEKAKGGTVALQDSAQVTLPANGLAADATVTFRTAVNAPAVPVPLSIVGRAYELAIDGSELTGTALLRLPLPPGVTPDQYDVAAYRWNGRLWERVTERDVTGGVQFGVDSPGIFALLGRWRLADASLALIKPDTVPGQQSIPLTVVGQYRFSAIPALQDGLVPARMVLKFDSSGGAGLVSGDPNLDTTVDEATLYFKPDPAQGQGLIQFQQAFEIAPGALSLEPGVSTRFYAVLTVDDAATPTRRVSSGVDYTQVLPIQIQNMEVVRPVLPEEERFKLRWKILLNGLTFQTPEARGPKLALQPVIDQGGVGDYKIVLEVEREGEWTPISNVLSIQLALRATATLPPGITPSATSAVVVVTTPGAIPSPAVPTRRPTPGSSTQARVTATPQTTLTPTLQPSPTPTRPDWASVFWADQYNVAAGECTKLHWRVENVITVLFNGQPATGNEEHEVCPSQTTTYTLRVTNSAGTQDRTVTIQVGTSNQPTITFTADQTQIAAGGCTTLQWSATDVKQVFLNGQGVAGVATQEVCPQQTANFELSVVTLAGQTVRRQVTITVVQGTPGTGATAAFYAEQYALPANGCTTLHWRVQNVQSVHLDSEGVAGEGTKQACPIASSQFYQLEIVDTSGATSVKEVVLMLEPALGANEIVAQGVVNSVTKQADVSSIEQGEQAGYAIGIDGIRVLFPNGSTFNQANVTLRLSQALLDLGDNSGIQWPVHSGQLVEFRATCEGSDCSIDYASDAYLFWRSE